LSWSSDDSNMDDVAAARAVAADGMELGSQLSTVPVIGAFSGMPPNAMPETVGINVAGMNCIIYFPQNLNEKRIWPAVVYFHGVRPCAPRLLSRGPCDECGVCLYWLPWLFFMRSFDESGPTCCKSTVRCFPGRWIAVSPVGLT
jgi:hypothetical protein